MEPFGDIAPAADNADDRPRFIPQRSGAGQPPGRHCLIFALRLEAVQQWLTGGNDLLLVLKIAAGQSFGEKVEVRLAECFLRVANPQSMSGGRVETEKPGVDVFDI